MHVQDKVDNHIMDTNGGQGCRGLKFGDCVLLGLSVFDCFIYMPLHWSKTNLGSHDVYRNPVRPVSKPY